MSQSLAQKPVIPSVPNLRDVGGHVTGDGRRVRTGLLYRFEQLGHIAEADRPALDALGLKTIYDLRTAAERAMLPDPAWPGLQEIVEDVLAHRKGAAPAQLLQLLADPEQANAALGNGKVVQMFAASYAVFIDLPSARAGVERRRLTTNETVPRSC